MGNIGSSRLERYSEEVHGGNGQLVYADVEAVRARPEGIVGHEGQLLAAWRRYQLPVALTEVHLACTREEQVRWLHDAWRGAHQARDQGAAVVAITPWAMLGAYDWDSLVTVPRGRYESGAFDIRAPEPRPTAVAQAIRQLAEHQPVGGHTLATPGWWQRSTRLLHPVAAAREAESKSGRPLLIVGAAGTLGQAFVRVAAERGLHVQSMSRADVDVTEAAAVQEALNRIQPWAVVNATGYVRVDDAERDSETCFGVNTVGAVNLATACQLVGAAMVTYSSDLVFGGDRSHPYTEHDLPRPQNVYGASKRYKQVMETGEVVLSDGSLLGAGEGAIAARLAQALAAMEVRS